MERKIIIPIIALSLLLCLTPIPAGAQGNSTILEKLDQIEARIEQLEKAQRSSNWENSVDEIQARIDQLRKELEIIRATNQWTHQGEGAVDLAADRGKEGSRDPGFEPQYQSQSFLSGVEITGFADFGYAARQGEDQPDDYGFGQMEVDLTTGIGNCIGIEAAIAYNTETETFGSREFVVDFSLFGSKGNHFYEASGIDHAGIAAGKFDVPFGIDWQVYPSIDRKLVSAPLIVESTHNAWNDYGVQAYLESSQFNMVVFGTNGFGYQWVDEFSVPTEISVKMAVGGRVGFAPHEWVEIGGSYASFFNEDDENDMDMIGADLQFNYEDLSIKGEYIMNRTGLTYDESWENSGFYAQGLYDFGRVFLVGRYGMLFAFEEGADDWTRISAGAGWVILQNAELRLEYQNNSAEWVDDVTFLQLVVGF
jgi:hypothetical protein